MSVLIKGFQMPTSCYYCGLTDTSFINCQAFSPCRLLEDDCEERRPDWCPLEDIPDKHGRLFDQDDVKAVLYDMPDTKDKWDAIALLEWAIDKRWCIEAEGADE